MLKQILSDSGTFKVLLANSDGDKHAQIAETCPKQTDDEKRRH